MNKRLKLAALGIIVFIFVLFLVLFSTGFLRIECLFGFGKPKVKIPQSHAEKEIFIEKDGFNVTELTISKESSLSINIFNKDNKTHRILLLGKNEKDKFAVVNEVFVKPNTSSKVTLIYSKEENFLPFSRNYKETLLSCTTCSGKRSQVKIIQEE